MRNSTIFAVAAILVASLFSGEVDPDAIVDYIYTRAIDGSMVFQAVSAAPPEGVKATREQEFAVDISRLVAERDWSQLIDHVAWAAGTRPINSDDIENVTKLALGVGSLEIESANLRYLQRGDLADKHEFLEGTLGIKGFGEPVQVVIPITRNSYDELVLTIFRSNDLASN